MTQYRLTALEWWQEVDRTPTCTECGTPRGDRDVERVRYREGDLVEVSGAEETRLLAAGALAPVGDPAVEGTVLSGLLSAQEHVDTSTAAEAVAASNVETAKSVLGATREGTAPKRPPQVAPKADWEAYVVAAGIATAEQVADMSKADLIDATK